MAVSACQRRTLVRLSVCVRYPVVFPGFFLFGTARWRINRYRFQPSCRNMRTQRLFSCLLAAGKLCCVLLLNLSFCANVNISCAATWFRFSPFHNSSAVWYACSAAHASLSAAAPLLTSAITSCVTDFLARSGILRLSLLKELCGRISGIISHSELQKKVSLKHSCLFLSSFLVRVVQPHFVSGVCVRSAPSNRKPFSQPRFPVLFPSLNPVGKKNHIYRAAKDSSAIRTGHVCH